MRLATRFFAMLILESYITAAISRINRKQISRTGYAPNLLSFSGFSRKPVAKAINYFLRLLRSARFLAADYTERNSCSRLLHARIIFIASNNLLYVPGARRSCMDCKCMSNKVM